MTKSLSLLFILLFLSSGVFAQETKKESPEVAGWLRGIAQAQLEHSMEYFVFAKSINELVKKKLFLECPFANISKNEEGVFWQGYYIKQVGWTEEDFKVVAWPKDNKFKCYSVIKTGQVIDHDKKTKDMTIDEKNLKEVVEFKKPENNRPVEKGPEISDSTQKIIDLLKSVLEARNKYCDKQNDIKHPPSVSHLVEDKFLDIPELKAIKKNGDYIKYKGYIIKQIKFNEFGWELVAWPEDPESKDHPMVLDVLDSILLHEKKTPNMKIENK